MELNGSTASLKGIPPKSGETDTQEKKEQRENMKRQNYLTFSQFMCYMAHGMACGLTGPTFVHLTFLFNTDISTLSFTHIFGSLGYVVGCIICGFIADKLNYQSQLSFSTLALGISIICVPWVPSVYVYYGADFIKNIFLAYLDTVTQANIIILWDDNKYKDPVMQAMHCAWSVGATICPFIIIPFLSDLPEDGTTAGEIEANLFNTTASPIYNDTYSTTTQNLQEINDDYKNVRYCFALVGGLIATVSLTGFIGNYLCPGDKVDETAKHVAKETESNGKPESISFRLVVMTLLFVFSFTAIWCDFVPSSYISTFVIKGFGWQAKYGSMLTSVFWISHGISRLLAIPLSYRITPGKMLLFDLTTATLAYILMLLIPLTNENIIWLATAIAGASIATIIPSSYLWTATWIKMSGAVGAVLIAGAAFGIMVSGPLAGYLCQEYTHVWIAYLSLLASVSSIGLFVVIHVTVKCLKKKGDREQLSLAVELEPMNAQKNDD